MAAESSGDSVLNDFPGPGRSTGESTAVVTVAGRIWPACARRRNETFPAVSASKTESGAGRRSVGRPALRREALLECRAIIAEHTVRLRVGGGVSAESLVAESPVSPGSHFE